VTFLVETNITKGIIELCQSLIENGNLTIQAEMSLAHDLDFDSVKLMQFFAGVEDLYPGIALEDWFIEHSSSGQDTIRSVVSYLSRFLNHRTAEG
jgi:acyl carrier protein